MKKHASVLTLALMMSAFAGSMAQAADLAPPPPPQIRPAVSDWTGPYAGAVLGGTCMEGKAHVRADNPPYGSVDNIYGPQTLNGCGLAGGLIAGFNYQIEDFLLGLEGDWTWSDKTGEGRTYLSGVNPNEYYQHDIFDPKWQFSLRARLGYLATSDTLLYVTGGVSWMKAGLTLATEGPTNQSRTYSRTHRGFIVGGGIEHAFTENIHLRGEYLYASYNTKRYGTYCVSCNPQLDVDLKPKDVHTFRLGVTWNFPVSQW